jgi:hypothetical protein
MPHGSGVGPYHCGRIGDLMLSGAPFGKRSLR